MSDLEARLSALMEAALPPAIHRSGTLDRAGSLLEAHPELATATIHVAGMLGEVEAVAAFLDRDPAAAKQPGGPRNWDPLLCL